MGKPTEKTERAERSTSHLPFIKLTSVNSVGEILETECGHMGHNTLFKTQARMFKNDAVRIIITPELGDD